MNDRLTTGFIGRGSRIRQRTKKIWFDGLLHACHIKPTVDALETSNGKSFAHAQKYNLALFIHPYLSSSDVSASIRTRQHYGENEWAKRHTWQSWRDHYKHKQTDLDSRIDKLVELYPPSSDRKGMAPVKRSVKRLRRSDALRDDSDGEVFDLGDDDTDKEQLREEAVEAKEEEEEEEDESLSAERASAGGGNRKRSRTGKSL